MKRCPKCNHFMSPLARNKCPHCAAIESPKGNTLRKGWATPYGFGDWAEPISYEEACERMRTMLATVVFNTK